MEYQKPKVGVSVIIIRENKILLGKRKNSHGSGTWAFPGGHLEKFESLGDCARRETLKETGLEIKVINENIAYITTNDIFEEEEKHYVTLFVKAEYLSGEAKNMEPKKCSGWNWFEWSNLPKPLFLPLKNLIKYKYNPFNN